MGTIARAPLVLIIALLAAGTARASETGTAAATAGTPLTSAMPAASPAAAAPRGLSMRGGHFKTMGWMVAEYKELRLRKWGDAAAGTVAIELQAGRDAVGIRIADGRTTVTRGLGHITIDSPDALEAVQQLLGGSAAVFATRAMLSELEGKSPLDAPQMSLLAAAAFVGSLVGDVEAPRRLSDKFMEKHRGIFRQVAARRPSQTCWADYSAETTSAWNELQGCMDDAADDGFFSGAYQRLACNGVWILRSEAAWFEFLKCLSPLTAVPQ